MRASSQQIIQRIGETDQLYLQGNSPELALERADLRLRLVTLSQLRQEQVHFLQEAVVLLEQGRIEFEEMPLSLYLNLSLHLAKAYMLYFEITKEDRFALITQQILKPLTSYGQAIFTCFWPMPRSVEKSQHWHDTGLASMQKAPSLISFYCVNMPLLLTFIKKIGLSS